MNQVLRLPHTPTLEVLVLEPQVIVEFLHTPLLVGHIRHRLSMTLLFDEFPLLYGLFLPTLVVFVGYPCHDR